MKTYNKEKFIIPTLDIIKSSADEIISTSNGLFNQAWYGDNEYDYKNL